MSLEDYDSLGLKVGLEIHQQLSTGKLFCGCPCNLSEKVIGRFNRVLRPSQSELGEIDRAALEEAQKKLRFTYESTENDCLVEADEEPPHEVSKEAIRTTLMLSQMVNSEPVDEIQFMRKIVIDGSNTGGFQRTALVSINGAVEVGGRNIPVETICLEEDAARRIAEEGRNIVFRLDRLGIPLIEIATSPEIGSPEEARDVAEKLGTLLRATRRVRRGIGSIREDVNISISRGARVEIKGVQELDLLPLYIQNEVKRQLALLDVSDELARRGVSRVEKKMVDLSDLLSKSESRVIRKALADGGAIMCARLAGLSGLLRPDKDGTKRLGPEFAAHARIAGVGGIFHSDELPGYSISEQEVHDIRKALGAGKNDSFVLVADLKDRASAALARVFLRAEQAIQGVPEETRDPWPDGTTSYSRPLPGSERMYPETDVPPFPVDEGFLKETAEQIPEYPEVTVKRLRQKHSLSAEQADTLVKNGFDFDFDELIKAGIPPKIAARTLINTLPELEGEGLDVSILKTAVLADVLLRVESGAFAKEAVPLILRRIVETNEDIEDALKHLDISGVEESEVVTVIDAILDRKREFVLERGERSIAPLMGLVMKELRGKVDGKIINDILVEKVRKLISEKK